MKLLPFPNMPMFICYHNKAFPVGIIQANSPEDITKWMCSKSHAHGSEWKSDKDNHWNECACGDKANTAAHSDANKDGKCDVCEYEVGTATSNPDNKPDDTDKPSDDVQSPQTGDNSVMWLWVTLLLVSGFGVVATTILGKKRSVR